MDNSINLEDPQIQDKKIYLLHFPKGVQNIQFSKGKITGIKNNIYFEANYSTEPGSSGCPILDYQNNLVTGIHKAVNIRKNKKIGIILKYAIGIFSKNKSKDMKTYKNLYSHTMDMIYTIPENNKTLSLFDGQYAGFVKRYKDVCKIVYNGLEYPLTQNFNLCYITNEDKNKKEIKITLKGIENVKDMSFMFKKCYCLKKVFATRTDFSKVGNMEAMFEWCKNFEEISDTSHWNLENVEILKGLFYMCTSLTSIPGMNNWNPIKLKNCEEMFLGCYKYLKPSEASKIFEWKNVPENINKAMKGYDVNNFWVYALRDNLFWTIYGTLKYLFKRIRVFLKLKY